MAWMPLLHFFNYSIQRVVSQTLLIEGLGYNLIKLFNFDIKKI